MVFGSRTSMAVAGGLLYFFTFSWISAQGAAMVVFRGERADLYCLDDSFIHANSIYWYKQEYATNFTPDQSKRIASYLSVVGSVQLALEYLSRGVILSTDDGHLHFPEILLSDEGEYTCSMITGIYHGLHVTVHVRPSGFSIFTTPMPVDIDDTINVTCQVNEIRPEPLDIYWDLDGVRLHGIAETVEVDATYGILQITNTLSHAVRAEDEGKTLTCVVVYSDSSGETMETRDIKIDVAGIKNSSAGVNVTLIVVSLVAVICACFALVMVAIVTRLRRQLRVMNTEVSGTVSASTPRNTADPQARGRNLQAEDLTMTPGVSRETAISDRMVGEEQEYEPVGVVATGTEYERVGGEDNTAYVADSTEASRPTTVQPR